MVYSTRELLQQRLAARAMVRAWRLAAAEARNLAASLECRCGGCPNSEVGGNAL